MDGVWIGLTELQQRAYVRKALINRKGFCKGLLGFFSAYCRDSRDSVGSGGGGESSLISGTLIRRPLSVFACFRFRALGFRLV